MKPVTIPPWPSTPFTVGRQYRVKRAFKALRDSFEAGEILIFDREAYSAYHGCTGYFFTQPGRQGFRSWDVEDDQPIEQWQELFEAL